MVHNSIVCNSKRNEPSPAGRRPGVTQTWSAHGGRALVVAIIGDDGVVPLATHAADFPGPAPVTEAVGGRAIAVPTDVSRRSEVEALVQTAQREFGSVDVMANVAGIIRNNLVVDTSEEELDAVLAVNLKGVYFGCQAAAKVMIGQRSGSIVNVASTGMDMPVPTLSCYALTKAAVAMLTRTLATEVGPHGVRVNAIAPGFTDSPMTQRTWLAEDGAVDEQVRDDLWKARSAQSPLARIGTPRDQALQMLYLASDASSFVTGQVLRANGGVTML